MRRSNRSSTANSEGHLKTDLENKKTVLKMYEYLIQKGTQLTDEDAVFPSNKGNFI